MNENVVSDENNDNYLRMTLQYIIKEENIG